MEDIYKDIFNVEDDINESPIPTENKEKKIYCGNCHYSKKVDGDNWYYCVKKENDFKFHPITGKKLYENNKYVWCKYLNKNYNCDLYKNKLMVIGLKSIICSLFLLCFIYNVYIFRISKNKRIDISKLEKYKRYTLHCIETQDNDNISTDVMYIGGGKIIFLNWKHLRKHGKWSWKVWNEKDEPKPVYLDNSPKFITEYGWYLTK